MIGNNNRFVVEDYDNKTIKSVVTNLRNIVSGYVPKTDNRIIGYVGNKKPTEKIKTY